MSGPNTVYKEGSGETIHTRGKVIKNGHTMIMQDVIADLTRLTYLEGEILRLQDRERKCATMDEAEKVALVRGFQEICDIVKLDRSKSSLAQIVEKVIEIVNVG